MEEKKNNSENKRRNRERAIKTQKRKELIKVRRKRERIPKT